MMLNRWRKYPRRKPKEGGMYLCTVRPENSNISYIKLLMYSVDEKRWIDISRRKVFDGYVVYRQCRATIPENRVYTDSLVERDDVVAWKKAPKTWKGKSHGN